MIISTRIMKREERNSGGGSGILGIIWERMPTPKMRTLYPVLSSDTMKAV